MEHKARPRIALLGPYSSRNLGDTATQMTAIQLLRERRPDAEIVGIAPEPEDTLRSLEVPAFPLDAIGVASGTLAAEFPWPPGQRGATFTDPRGLRRAGAFARTLDLLVVSGGGQLDDFWGGAWTHPFELYRWTALARRHGAHVAFVATGVDRLRARLSRWFTVRALHRADHRSLRDAESLQTLREYGLARPTTVCPDMVFAMRRPASLASQPDRRFVVLNPVARATWAHGADARHEAYLAHVVACAESLARAGLSIRIACSQTKMDTEDARQLAGRLEARGIVDVTTPATGTVDAYLDAVRGAELVIAARLHGVILALVAGSPVVALSPLPKVTNVMADAGLARYCLPLLEFDGDDLATAVRDALADVDGLRAHIAATNRAHAAAVGRVFDDVAALLPPDVGA